MIAELTESSTTDFYEWLLPYHYDQSEPLRIEAAREPDQAELWERYDGLFKEYDYLEGYVHHIQ